MNRLHGRWVTDPDGIDLELVGFEGKNDMTAVFSDEDGVFRKVGIVDVLRWEDENQRRGRLRDEDRLTCSTHGCWNTTDHLYAWLTVIDLRAA
jgi:hypothetical protein